MTASTGTTPDGESRGASTALVASGVRRCLQAGIELSALPDAVPDARRYVRDIATLWGLVVAEIDDAQLITTELLTNAIKASQMIAESAVKLRMRWRRQALRIELWDGSDEPPEICSPTLEAEYGRGLFLISAIASAWSFHRCAGGGKVVWAELSTSNELGPTNPG